MSALSPNRLVAYGATQGVPSHVGNVYIMYQDDFPLDQDNMEEAGIKIGDTVISTTDTGDVNAAYIGTGFSVNFYATT